MEWLYLAFGLLLILGTGFFVAVEFALVALDQPTVRRAVENGDKAAEPLLRCLTSLSTQLSSCQLGITLTTLLTGFVMEPSVGRLLKTPLTALGLPSVAVDSVSVVAAMVLATLLSMLLGELIPKNMSISLPFRMGRALARPQLAFTVVFKPAILLLNGFSNKVLHLFGLEAKEEVTGARTPAELSSMVRRSAEMGTLDQGTANFLSRTFSFAERTAADVMTPRIRLETIDSEQSVADVIEAARRTGYSRFPVLGDSPDDIRGVVHVKKAVAVPRSRRADLPAGAIMSEVLRVPETVHLDSLLSELRGANLQLAVVLDEWGGTAGVATLEDLVEEIVGEVSDEHDKVKPGVLQSAAGAWYFPGIMRPDEVSQLVPQLDVPDEAGYETVGGYIMAELGRIARVGDQVSVDGGLLEVERMDGRRIDRVSFIPRADDDDPAAADEHPGAARESAQQSAAATAARRTAVEEAAAARQAAASETNVPQAGKGERR